MSARQVDLRQGYCEQKVKKADAEEGNMSKPQHAAAQCTVATSPVGAVKKEAYYGTRRGTEQHGDPTDEQVQIDGAIYIAAPQLAQISAIAQAYSE